MLLIRELRFGVNSRLVGLSEVSFCGTIHSDVKSAPRIEDRSFYERADGVFRPESGSAVGKGMTPSGKRRAWDFVMEPTKSGGQIRWIKTDRIAYTNSINHPQRNKMSRLSLAMMFLALGFAGNIACAQTLVTLHSFSGEHTGAMDGALPQSGVVQATNGGFYGTTTARGANDGQPDCAPGGCGTVFRITPGGALATIYSFCAQNNCTDGAPWPGALIQATNGDFYGLTEIGVNGAGTIFKVTPAGTLTTVYNFCSQNDCADGYLPNNLFQAANGELYGTTAVGGLGSALCPPDGTCGTIFKITLNGALTTLYSFCSEAGCADGHNPTELIQATGGEFYGTTSGTTPACQNASCGTIFKMSPNGALTTLYTFCSQSGCADGAYPTGWLVQATNGDFYGTTSAGGIGANCTAAGGCGTIFKITADGALNTLYNFCSQAGCTDGRGTELIQAASGNLYGITPAGGTYGSGSIFKITLGGGLTTLYSFCSQPGCPDGEYPTGLIEGSNGIFYGTTSQGGVYADGTVFAFSTGQPPFVETRPNIGVVGEVVTILGYKLTDATSVTFNGTPATFTFVSATEINTTVPTGATTGKVEVISPDGTLSSNIAFEVAP
jgi:uncharacterized repeat protein (TIGR03803 family)